VNCSNEFDWRRHCAELGNRERSRPIRYCAWRNWVWMQESMES
jgi:hypothetical protein